MYIFVCGDEKLREEVYGESEMMKNVNQKVGIYDDPLDAYLVYDKKKMDEAGMKQMIVDNNKKEIAKKMLEDNLDMNLIMKYTGLTLDEIEDLKKEKE